MNIPAMEIPSFRMHLAVEQKIENKFLFVTGGGLGDYICAEPSFRHAMTHFKFVEISLASQFPELFRHLPFKKVYNEKIGDKPNFADYFAFNSMPGHENLQSEFMCHMFAHCVDYISLVMFRAQLSNAEKCVRLVPTAEEIAVAAQINPATDIAVHAGLSWQSRTFPKWWWDDVLAEIKRLGCRPVLIGNDTSINERGTVSVNPEGCLDLRNKLAIMESVAVLQRVGVVLTNDSSPVHMAASGNAWLGTVSTARHPDYITHYRNGGEFGWRQRDFTHRKDWDNANFCPNNMKGISIDKVDPDALISWLPEPKIFAEWGVEKCLTQIQA